MFKLSNIFKITSLTSLLIFALATPALAQESNSTTSSSLGLEVSSPIYDYTIKPGAVQQDIIKIKNVGAATQTFYPEVRDFKPLNETGAPDFLKVGDNNGNFSLVNWISFTNQAITLKPNESTAFNFNITVPAAAEPGGHYGGILFSTKAPDVSGTGVGISSEVGSLILVRVAGNAKEALSVKQFSTSKNLYEEANVPFTIRLENTGNVHVQPKGVVTIKNMIGGQVAALDVNQLGSNVLPQSVRAFDGTWKDAGFKLGLYTATLVVNYGNPAQSVTSQISFWIVPWKTLLVLAAILVILILILVFAIKRYNRWIISKANKQPQQPQ